MKQCPNCKTNYTDESLRFCLADGGSLISIPDAAETVQMSFGNEPMRINVPPDSVPTFFTPQIPQTQPIKKGVSPIIVGVLGVLLLLVVGVFAAYILLRPTDNKNLIATISPTPPLVPTATPNDETAKLKEEMANLQKQLQDQKNQKTTQPAETFSPPKPTGKTTARANSPGDGFLALRSEPNSATGERLAKIPHGANVNVISCQDYSKTSKLRGRWCQVIYNGQAGWAFDAYLIY